MRTTVLSSSKAGQSFEPCFPRTYRTRARDSDATEEARLSSSTLDAWSDGCSASADSLLPLPLRSWPRRHGMYVAQTEAACAAPRVNVETSRDYLKTQNVTSETSPGRQVVLHPTDFCSLQLPCLALCTVRQLRSLGQLELCPGRAASHAMATARVHPAGGPRVEL